MPILQRPRPITLRIELLDVVPLVWRRVLVSNQWTLASLHGYLQWVMGWTDSHAHEFEVGEGVIAPEWWIEEVGMDSDVTHFRDERRVSVAAVLSELGANGEFEYHYDMGDSWKHRLVFEPLSPAWKDADRTHEQHGDMVRWIGGVFDPKGFDLNRLNRDYRTSKRRRR